MPSGIGQTDEFPAAYAAAREACRRDLSLGGAYLGSFFLPRHKRDGVYAVWAFARLIGQAAAVENAGGECCSGAGGVAPLLKSRVDAMCDVADRLQLPLPQFRDDSQWIMLAASEAVRRFEVPRGLWHELIDGLIALRALERVATWRSLDAHLAASGGVVGRMIAAVLGATHSDVGELAAGVGRAVALMNILRSIRRDIAANRVRLPLEDLARFRYSEREMLAAAANDNFNALVRHEVGRARELLECGAAGTGWLADDGSRMAVGAFIALQLRGLDEIEREPEALLRDVAGAKAKGPSLAAQLRALPAAWRIAKTPATSASGVRATQTH